MIDKDPGSKVRMSRRGEMPTGDTPEARSSVRSNMGKRLGRDAVTGAIDGGDDNLSTPIMSRRGEGSLAKSQVRSNMGRRAEADPASNEFIRTIEAMPTFETMRPEPNEARVYVDGVFDIRQSSSKNHQDGVAYNPDTETVVVCDGMGGVGPRSETKNHFAFALAHSIATLPNILDLEHKHTAERTIEQSGAVLESLGVMDGFSSDREISKLKGSFSKIGALGAEFGSTVAAAQRSPDNPDIWRVATLGDSSVIILGTDGDIKDGYGEAMQDLKAGRVGEKTGTTPDGPMSSCLGISYTDGSFSGITLYEGRDKFAEFHEVTLQPNEKIVIASDAYLQSSPPSQLIADVREPAQSWQRRAPRYGDDTTLAIISQ